MGHRIVSVEPIFAWWDCWIGAYWDRRMRSLYILPIPCIGLVIRFEHVQVWTRVS
jgi:hypothetical protein